MNETTSVSTDQRFRFTLRSMFIALSLASVAVWLAGAISGAYLGVSAIPKHFLDALEDGHKGKSYIEQLAERLAAICRAA